LAERPVRPPAAEEDEVLRRPAVAAEDDDERLLDDDDDARRDDDADDDDRLEPADERDLERDAAMKDLRVSLCEPRLCPQIGRQSTPGAGETNAAFARAAPQRGAPGRSTCARFVVSVAPADAHPRAGGCAGPMAWRRRRAGFNPDKLFASPASRGAGRFSATVRPRRFLSDGRLPDPTIRSSRLARGLIILVGG
jgi:hypothetical protein